MIRVNKKNKFKDRKYICTSSGVIGPNAMCGSVSVYHDEKGHRCMANGHKKCKLKREEINLSAEAVKDIKMMLIYSGLTISEIAKNKGISQSQVSRIKHGDCYADVDID